MDTVSGEIDRSGICLCVLCGLPAAGKSTLVRTLPSYTRKKGWRIFILSYDEIIPEEAYELRKENDALMDTQSSWKSYRQEVLQCLDAFLQSQNAPVCANRDSLGFCQIYLRCPLNVCLTRNRMRGCPLPDEVIVEMAKRIEPPNPLKNTWEQKSLTLTSTIDFSQQDIELLIQLLGAALENPLTPIQDNTEQKEADRQSCASSIVHQADQACRRLVSQAMRDAKECKWTASNMKSLAAELNQLKTKFLEDLRKQVLQGYPICPGETINVELVVSRAVSVFDQEKNYIMRKYSTEPVKHL
ncbi:L-seryl-tRNA(Sec) kinase-like isoform X2 [Anguilla rostrata]|uniref:L-seryl-tRNA(Sec) kinase-like isoform X2 n=1 Tax=Anguilla rostrata TaxID=7938 RepID=UPI0030CCF2ED